MENFFDQDEADFASEYSESNGPGQKLAPIIDFQTLMDHERLHKPLDLARSLLTKESESVLIRRPYRWTKDGIPLPDASASLGLEQVCTQYGWKIVATYGPHFAIVTPTT